MIRKFIGKFLGDQNERRLKRLRPIIGEINSIAEKYAKEITTDEQVKIKTSSLKERLKSGETLEDIKFEAFALVKQACSMLYGRKYEVRGQEETWNIKSPFDIQLVGGMVLHEGDIAEMKTGEGKTLVSTMPVYLNALTGKGVHVVTVNEYLAERDAEWMGFLYDFLGLSIGVAKHGQNPDEKKVAYNADITYGTNNEFGFDYLRDNMAVDPSQIVQRDLHYAIVDEVDSILIDEARTPLIISSPAGESTEKYGRYASLIPQLEVEKDYTVDEKARAVSLTEDGITKMEKALGMENIYSEAGNTEVHHIEQALKAHALFERDTDYVVKDGEVMIVDEFTGRLMPGRRYSDGLHQAIEAKERVEVKRESRTLATISFQNYFRLYEKLAGMTGTAITEADEFANIYGLEVIVIPTNRPIARKDNPDAIYKNTKGKFMAAVKFVKDLHKKGQPVLVGTVSIQKSEYLSDLLKKAGVPHAVLNAKFHEKEAEIIANAGQRGTVTIATNMAGRGTDIKLGDGVEALGGLFVLGTERHESRRIDNQLRGRSGRQGDAGESRFLVSMEDDLMRLFGSDRVQKMMEVMKIPDDMPIETRIVSSAIESAQKKVEGRNFEIRKHLVEYDDVMNKHREIMYDRRRKALLSEVMENDVLLLVEREAELLILNYTPGDNKRDWDYAKILELTNGLFRDPPITIGVLENCATREDMIEKVRHHLLEGYKKREATLPDYDEEKGSSGMRQVERAVYLRTIDALWMEHIDAMTRLREGVALYGYGQRDPLIEYKSESFQMLERLLATIRTNTVTTLFRMTFNIQMPAMKREGPKNIVTNEDQIEGAITGDANNPVVMNAGSAGAQQPEQPKVGRNEPCPCGSGKKYKKCHG
jgi:preprotein translocase subunit SecA